jgi:hypothetical protein
LLLKIKNSFTGVRNSISELRFNTRKRDHIMKRLTEVGESWRDYLYANHNGYYNDVKDFITRVHLISDSQEQLLETMLEDEPNMELVKECKEEIAFQRGQLEDIAKEFVDYYNSNIPSKQKLITDDILNDLCKEGTNDYLYEIATEWQEWGNKVHRIWDNLDDSYGRGLNYIHDDLCKLVMKEVYSD